MPRRKKKPEPATQEQLNAIQDAFRDERSVIADAYFSARRRGDIVRCQELWELWKVQRSKERQLLLTASQSAL